MAQSARVLEARTLVGRKVDLSIGESPSQKGEASPSDYLESAVPWSAARSRSFDRGGVSYTKSLLRLRSACSASRVHACAISSRTSRRELSTALAMSRQCRARHRYSFASSLRGIVVPEFFGVTDKSAEPHGRSKVQEATINAIDLPQSVGAPGVEVCQPGEGDRGRRMDWTILTVLPAIMVLALALIASRPGQRPPAPAGRRISKPSPTLR